MENLNTMIDVNKVIGSAVIAPNGATVIPVSQVSFGFASGGGEYEFPQSKKDDFPFAGGAGAGWGMAPQWVWPAGTVVTAASFTCTAPRVTTSSPPFSPDRISVRVPSVAPGVTSRFSNTASVFVAVFLIYI